MNKKSLVFLILVIIWMGFIFLMSNDTGNDSDSKSKDIVLYIIDKYDKLISASFETINYHQSEEFIARANYVFRKICHFGEYFILSVLVFNFLFSFNKYKLWLCGIYSVFICFGYAGIDEYHQTFITGRVGSFSDTLIDVLGSIVACFIVIIIFFKINHCRRFKN